MSEAALANVILSDYRNFGHGRHHWFAKKSATSAVISLTTPEEEEIADRTIALLPRNVPIIRVSSRLAGPVAGLGLLEKAMRIVGLIGDARRMIPGRPGVPAFGSKIYHLRAKPRILSPLAIKDANYAVQSKIRTFRTIRQDNSIEYWERAFQEFVAELERGSFGAAVFDFDGTICDPIERFAGIAPEMAKELEFLLRHNVLVGVATGRGVSVRDSLRAKLPKKFWPSVLVGYYNGSDIGSLDQEIHPDKSKPLDSSLKEFLEELSIYKDQLGKVGISPRPKQVSIEPAIGVNTQEMFLLLSDVIARHPEWGLRAVISSHSIDVLAPGVSKLRLVDTVKREITKRSYESKASYASATKEHGLGTTLNFLGANTRSVWMTSRETLKHVGTWRLLVLEGQKLHCCTSEPFRLERNRSDSTMRG